MLAPEWKEHEWEREDMKEHLALSHLSQTASELYVNIIDLGWS